MRPLSRWKDNCCSVNRFLGALSLGLSTMPSTFFFLIPNECAGFCLDIARENRRRRRERNACRDAMFAAENGERALGLRNRQKIEQFPRQSRHERQNEDRDLAQDFGSHIEHSALPRGIAL